MNQPLISIIITVLNGGKTIENCLLSIKNQHFTDYELVIVDGGSKDQTLQIVDSIPIHNKIVQSIPGLGLYAGLNKGINLSSGRWLYFIGCDDELYSPDTLELVSLWLITADINTKVFIGKVNCPRQKMLLKPLLGSPYFMRHQVHHQGMFYHRDVFEKSLYDEKMKIASDYGYNLELALRGIGHKSMEVIVCNFGGEGISETQLKQGYKEMQQIHNRLYQGISRIWVVSYFALRRNIASFFRRFNLNILNVFFKRIFG